MSRQWMTALLLWATVAGGPLAAAELPTVEAVYAAAEAARFDAARAMVQQLLDAMPHSGPPHYVAARVEAMAGNWFGASRELAEAKRITPGLPFVQEADAQAFAAEVASHVPGADDGTGGFDAGWLLIGALVIAGLLFILSKRNRPRHTGLRLPHGPTGGAPQAPNAAAGGPQSPTGMGRGGIGGGLGSGLATGLGIGAGIAAGQALGQSLFGGDEANDAAANEAEAGDDVPADEDAGSDHFGLTDAGWGGDDAGGGDGGGGDG